MLNISKNTLTGWAPSVPLHHHSTLTPITLCQSVTPHLTFASWLFFHISATVTLLSPLPRTRVGRSTYWKFCRCPTLPWRRGPRSWPWPSCASCWAAGGAGACAVAWRAAWRRLGCRTCPTSSGFSATMSSSSPTTRHGLTSPFSHLWRGREEERGLVLVLTAKTQKKNPTE